MCGGTAVSVGVNCSEMCAGTIYSEMCGGTIVRCVGEL